MIRLRSKLTSDLILAAIAGCLIHPVNAQLSTSTAARWLAAAPPIPDFHVPASRAEWDSQRAQIRNALWKSLGALPPRPKQPRVTTLSRDTKDGFVLEHFQFDNGAGAIVPGYVFVPAGLTRKAPAILYCHWHGGQYDNGKEEMLKAEHTPEAPGPTLAKRGYVVLGIDAYCFGERNGLGPGGPDEKGGAGEMTASKFNLWLGRSLWGMILRDDLIALDYLLSRPEVDSRRTGVTGISMGASRSWWLMALDERLQAGVAVACLTRYQDLIANQGLKYHGIYYYVPGLLTQFDTEAIVALIAPRPVLFLTGDKDEASPVAGIRKIEERVRPAFQLFNNSDHFQSVIYPGLGHVYTMDMWQRMLGWMDQHLGAF